MSYSEDLYIAPEVEVDEQLEALMQMLVESWQSEYTQLLAQPSNYDASLPMEFAKSIGHWRSSVAPLHTLCALLRESIDRFDEASDLTIQASGTLAACESITEMMQGVLINVYMIQGAVNESNVMSSHLLDQAEELMIDAGLPLPDLQLDLFEAQA